MRKKTAIEMSKCLDDISSGIEMIGNFKDNKYVVSKVERMFKENLLKLDSKMDDIGKEQVEALKEAIKSVDAIETNRLISEIKTFISKNIVYKVVFMPYKASMWDSLESIWMAADKDERCEALVVPITYYELDRNQNPIKKVNERDRFPEYVNIINDEEYDLENDLPDIIYIHNPYDDTNLITRVESRYYSWNLKNYCEKLVYVPYYKWIDGSSATTFRSAMYYADYTVQNSDDAVRRCIDASPKYAEILGVSSFEVEVAMKQKLINLGSPEVDKVVSLNESNTPIPVEWVGKIKKSRVNVLYNMTIGDVLQSKSLDKLKSNLSFFKNNRNKAFVIWRPHPLLRQTFVSMLPNLVSEYDKLLKDFVDDDYGVLDESDSMYYAIFWSDMCYGDKYSSLSELYKYTGKIMLNDLPKIIQVRNNKYTLEMLNKLRNNNAISEEDFSLENVVDIIMENSELKNGKCKRIKNSGHIINDYMLKKLF